MYIFPLWVLYSFVILPIFASTKRKINSKIKGHRKILRRKHYRSISAQVLDIVHCGQFFPHSTPCIYIPFPANTNIFEVYYPEWCRCMFRVFYPVYVILFFLFLSNCQMLSLKPALSIFSPSQQPTPTPSPPNQHSILHIIYPWQYILQFQGCRLRPQFGPGAKLLL